MVFGPFMSTLAWCRARSPVSAKAFMPNFNFITIHCMFTGGNSTGLD
jgi:hypothetical protein